MTWQTLKAGMANSHVFLALLLLAPMAAMMEGEDSLWSRVAAAARCEAPFASVVPLHQGARRAATRMVQIQ